MIENDDFAQVLSDDAKRKQYDRHGEEGVKEQGHGDPFSRYVNLSPSASNLGPKPLPETPMGPNFMALLYRKQSSGTYGRREFHTYIKRIFRVRREFSLCGRVRTSCYKGFFAYSTQ